MRNEYFTYFQVFLKVETIIPPSEVKTARKTVTRKVFCIQLRENESVAHGRKETGVKERDDSAWCDLPEGLPEEGNGTVCVEESSWHLRLLPSTKSSF